MKNSIPHGFAAVILLLVAGFIFHNETTARREAQARLALHARVIGTPVWNLDRESPKAYLAQAIKNDLYEKLVVTTDNGAVFFSGEGQPLVTLADQFLAWGRLIPLLALHADVIHDGKIIGRIEAAARIRTIYADLYAVIVGLLLVLIAHLYLHLLRTNRDLDFKVRERTTNLQTSEKRFRLLIENTSDIITVINGAGLLRFVSPSVRRNLGYDAEELLNRNAFELIEPEDAGKIAAALRLLLADSTAIIREEFRFRHRDGSWRILQAIGRSIPNQAPDGFIVVNARDITESRKLEEQLRQAQKMDAIGRLAGGVAHDFNNILAATMMQAELLQMEENLPAEVREGLAQIYNYSERAANLTRQLLLFSRKQVLQPRDVNLNELVNNLNQMLQRIIGEEYRLQLNLHPDALSTHADPGMLEQVLMNLVVNARDAMPKGGQVLIETGKKILTQEEAASSPDVVPGDYLFMRVTDGGCGIPPENLRRIFEPFFTTKKAGEGTGLGLATVFGIVQQHRGMVTVESEVGRGTTFHVFLPVIEPQPRSAEIIATNTKPRTGTETILLVEDEAVVRKLTRSVLEKANYRVCEAPNGVAALRLWKQTNLQIDLLLTDIVMPEGLGGWELAARLRDDKPNLKVVFVTGYSSEKAGGEIVLQKGQVFLQKPFSPNQALEAVRQCLES